jgi:hypothetical protein
MILRGMTGPSRERVTGGWRKLHNEELHELYSSQRIATMSIKMDEMDSTTACIGGILVGKSGGKELLKSLRHRWEDNIKMDHKEVYCKRWTGLNWLMIVSRIFFLRML